MKNKELRIPPDDELHEAGEHRLDSLGVALIQLDLRIEESQDADLLVGREDLSVVAAKLP
jgi:hypothetical protein